MFTGIIEQTGIITKIEESGTNKQISIEASFIDELKIDRSFIMEVSENAESRAIVSSIVHLAKSLNLSTVAEGIEKEEELKFLQTLDCHQYQGYFYSRSIPPKEFINMVSN